MNAGKATDARIGVLVMVVAAVNTGIRPRNPALRGRRDSLTQVFAVGHIFRT
jgi:hypothetical protein